MSMNRREFLGAAALGAGAVAAANCAPQTTSSEPAADAAVPASIAALKPMTDGIVPISDDERRGRIAKAQKLMHEKVYWIPINVQYTIEGVNKNLNYEAGSDEMMRVYAASWKD